MVKRRDKWTLVGDVALGLGALFALGLFLHLSQTCYLADSEIWGIAVSREVGHWATDNISIYFKFPFHLLLRGLYFLNLDNAGILLGARTLFAALGLASIAATGILAWLITGSRRQTLLSLLFLTTTTTFLNQGFRVRSDLLAAFFNLTLMVFYTRTLRKPAAKARQNFYFWGLLHVVQFLTTPKALYFFFAELVFVALSFPRRMRRRALAIGFFAPVVLLAPLFFLKNYSAAVDYFLNSFGPQFPGGDLTHPYYWSRESFMYVTITVLRNPLFSLALCVTLFFFALHGRQNYRGLHWHWHHQLAAKSAFLVYAGLIFIFTLGHNDKLPFFIAACLPALCIAASYIIEPLGLMMAKFKTINRFRPLLANAVCLAMVVGLTIQAWSYYQANQALNPNFDQLATIRALERYMASSRFENFFDGIGALSLQNPVLRAPGIGEDQQNQKILAAVQKADPALIFYSAKFNYLEPALSVYLDLYYAHRSSGIYARAVVFTPELGAGEFSRTNVEYQHRRYNLIDVTQLTEAMWRRFHRLGPDDSAYLYTGELGEFYQLPATGAISDRHILVENQDGKIEMYDPALPLKNLYQNGRYLYVPVSVRRLTWTLADPVRLPTHKSYVELFSFDPYF